MSRNQRLAFLGIAALIAVIAVVVIVAAGGDGDDDSEGEQAAATATPTATAEQTPVEEETPTPTPTETPTPTPNPVPVLRSGKVTEIEVNEGDRVRFEVRHNAPEEVHVHGYDLLANVDRGQPASFNFVADTTGIFEIELEQSAEPIGELTVEP